MAKIKIVADSTTDIPENILKEKDITVVPLSVFFGDKEYRDGIDINPEQFYSMLKDFDGFPTTSQVTPAMFKKAYMELTDQADIILSMHLSSKFSGTFNSAQIAAQDLEGVQIICYDSESATMGYGFQVLEAYKAVQEGCRIEEVLKRVEMVKETTRVFVIVPDLEHLHKGGRIGKAAVLLGGLLNIIPILTIEDGLVAPVEKVRGKKRAVKRIFELVEEGIKDFGGKDNINLAVMHSDNYAAAKELAEELKNQFGLENIMINQVGVIVGTHTGPGVVGVIFHKKIS